MMAHGNLELYYWMQNFGWKSFYCDRVWVGCSA